MDPNWKGLGWVGNIYQKFEEICSDVEEFMSQESYEFVQNQFQTVGANVKQICSELMEDVFYSSSEEEGAPDSSLVQYIDSLTCEKTMLNNSEDAKLESGDEDNLLIPSSMKSVGEEHLNSCLRQNTTTEMDENSKASVMERFRKEEQSLSEMSEVGADAEISPSRASLSSIHYDCESELSSESLTSCPISIELTGCKSSISIAEPPSNYVMEVESRACKVSDVGDAPLIGDLSAESTFYTERSDDSTSEEANCNALTKGDMKTIQLLDESCILVDDNEHRSYKKKLQRAIRRRSANKEECEQQATSLGDLDAGSKLHRKKSSAESTDTSDSESLDHDFSESEWEII